MFTLNPYLNFMGNTEEAFNFYKSVFGGEFTILQRFKDTPDADKMPPADRNKIMHVALPVGNGNVLMATDALECSGHSLTVGNNFSISINTDNKAEVDKLFKGLSAGGRIEMAPQDMFWGAYFCMFTDQFGIQWMVNHNYKK